MTVNPFLNRNLVICQFTYLLFAFSDGENRQETQHYCTDNEKCHESTDERLSFLESLRSIFSDRRITKINAEQLDAGQNHKHSADEPDET